jgi:hypothetical protein
MADLKRSSSELARALVENIRELEVEISKLQRRRDELSKVLRTLDVLGAPGEHTPARDEGLSLEDAIGRVMPPAGSPGATVAEVFEQVLPLPVTKNLVTIFNVKNVIQRRHVARGWERVSRDERPTKWRCRGQDAAE